MDLILYSKWKRKKGYIRRVRSDLFSFPLGLDKKLAKKDGKKKSEAIWVCIKWINAGKRNADTRNVLMNSGISCVFILNNFVIY